MDAENLLTITIFSGVNEDKINSFLHQTPHAERHYAPGETVAMRGDLCLSLYFLLRGTVRAGIINSKGKELTVEDIEAPNLLAPAVVYATNSVFPVTVQALTPCEVCILNKDGFLRFMQQEDTVLRNYMRIISDRCLFLGQKMNTFALQNLKERLAAELLSNPNVGTQQQIADRLGVARPSLARVMAELVDEGCIIIEKRNIVVVDDQKLRRYQ